MTVATTVLQICTIAVYAYTAMYVLKTQRMRQSLSTEGDDE